MIEILPLTNENFNDFFCLLRQRGEAPEDYYIWKYLKQPYSFFPAGFVAYLDGHPVGCIGVINCIFIDNLGVKNHATWFADWYVVNEGRCAGVGSKLLKEVLILSPFAFGVPAPPKAQKLALNVGYNKKDNYYEFILPCNPIIFGYRRYNDFYFKRVIRTFFYWCQTPKKKTGQYVIIKDKEEIKKLLLDIVFFPNSFHYSKAYVEWLLNIPSNIENARKYFLITSSKEEIFLIMSDSTQGNLIRARILYDNVKITCKENIFEYFNLAKFLEKEGFHYLQFCKYLKSINTLNRLEFKEIPQYSSIINSEFSIEYACMESRWRDIEMLISNK